MAVKQELQITIGPDGGISLKVKGPKGSRCLDLTRDLEEELGVVLDRELTSEFYEAEAQVEAEVGIGSGSDGTSGR